jgi:hypothetical protein
MTEQERLEWERLRTLPPLSDIDLSDIADRVAVMNKSADPAGIIAAACKDITTLIDEVRRLSWSR